MRIRDFPNENYKSIFINGKTLRMKYNDTPMLEPEYPEFYDIGINSKCYGACIDYCYVSAMKTGINYTNIVEKINKLFKPMSLNERPYQLAIGGSGEPTLHPDFISFLKTVKKLDIVPNYTTNGMHLSKRILEATEKYCGGVALTCHPHLIKHWETGIEKLKDITRLNLHIIISNRDSIDNFFKIKEKYESDIEYFVLLPYTVQGFAKPKELHFDYLFEQLKVRGNFKNVAFGALFYPHLMDKNWLDLSLYEPELLSKYINMEHMDLYSSSFSITPIKRLLID